MVSPNRGSRDYGIYVSLTLATLLIAIVLENESLPAGSATLHYVIVPQLAMLHGAAPVDLAPPGALARDARRGRDDGDDRRRRAARPRDATCSGRPIGSRCSLLAALLAFLWRKAISTQRGFVNASSIYIGSKETPGARDGAAEAVARLAAVGRA